MKQSANLQNVALMVIDVQGTLANSVDNSADNLKQTLRLINIAKILGIPTWYVEHCPEQLGPTAPELQPALQHATKLSKRTFSLWKQADIEQQLGNTPYENWIVCGIECHVCVYQSVSDMINANYTVHVVEDAVASRNTADFTVGIEAMRSMGACITSVEMLAFELMQTPDHPGFKDVLTLIK